MTGGFVTDCDGSSYNYGAFKGYNTLTTATSGGGSDPNVYINDFDSSRANAIYTDSGHVYPLSLALNFIIKA